MSDGVKDCCERLDLKQELLNYYIQQDDRENVMSVCQEYSQKAGSDQATAGDLWIQALTYFRDLPPPQDEIYLERALSAM